MSDESAGNIGANQEPRVSGAANPPAGPVCPCCGVGLMRPLWVEVGTRVLVERNGILCGATVIHLVGAISGEVKFDDGLSVNLTIGSFLVPDRRTANV